MSLLALLLPLQGHAEIWHHVDAAGFSFSFVISLNVELSPPILPLRNLETGICESTLAETKQVMWLKEETHPSGKLASSRVLSVASPSSLVLNPPPVQFQSFYHRSEK